VPAHFNKLRNLGLTIHELKRIRILSSVTDEMLRRRKAAGAGPPAWDPEDRL
jgi:hypothetical protein